MPKVTIHAASSDNTPGSQVYELTNPDSLTNGINTFFAPTGATLSPSTKYFVVVGYKSGGLIRIVQTRSDDEDAGAASGWSIADTGRHRRFIDEPPHPGWGWANSLQVAIMSSETAMQQSGPAQIEATPQVSDAGADGQWTEGETVEVRLTFNQIVNVDTSGGTPSVEISLGGSATRNAAYVSGSGSLELVFAYTLVDGDGSHGTMLVTSSSLTLNGGSITANAGGAGRGPDP